MRKGGTKIEKFISPQTGSEYDVLGSCNDLMVCFRKLDSIHYRVRVQGNSEKLERVLEFLKKSWGGVKDGDHISVVVSLTNLPGAVADAVNAIIKEEVVNTKK